MLDLQLSGSAMMAHLSARRYDARQWLDETRTGRAWADELNAFLPLDLDAGTQAAASDARRENGRAGPLEGLLVSVKDNVALDGAPTTGSSPLLKDHRVPEGPVISRLRDSGAIFVGKTNLHELAFGITGDNAFTGPVLNPFDSTRVAGGSSSGAAVSVATGACAVAIVTDTGGSARVPAAFCGIVGFRPTTGRYPASGFLPLSPSRDALGVLARYVEDIRAVDTVITDERSGAERANLTGVRLGVVRAAPMDPAIADRFEQVLTLLTAAGVELVPVDIAPAISADDACGFLIAVYETARSMETLAKEALGLSLAEFASGIASPDVRALIASEATPNAIPGDAYRDAIDVHLPRLRKAYDDLLSGVDALIHPTVPVLAPHIGQSMIDVGGTTMPAFPACSMLTRPDSMAGLPSISLPGGLVNDMPIGVQLTGRPGQDAALLALAEAVERALPPRPVATRCHSEPMEK